MDVSNIHKHKNNLKTLKHSFQTVFFMQNLKLSSWQFTFILKFKVKNSRLYALITEKYVHFM